jgi:hypothetical protein
VIASTIPDQVLITLNTLELVAILYLALGISRIRERLATLEAKLAERERTGNGHRAE